MSDLHRATKLSFLHCQRGAILVPALVMAPLLVAACFYEIQVWKNVIQRESVQGGADAIAAGGAVWLSAGMNLLGLVNVVMGIILSVFIAIRAAEILSVAFAVVFTGIALTPFGAGWAAAAALRAENFAEKSFQAERKYAPKIMRALNIATSAERVIARAVPYVSLAMSTSYGPETGLGFAGNFSITPTGLDRAVSLGVGAIPERMGRIDAAPGPDLPADAKILQKVTSHLKSHYGSLANPANLVGSLPVEGEGYSQVCARAAADWTTLPGVRSIPFIDKVGMALGFIGGNFTMLLCQPLAEAADVLENKLNDQANDAVKNKADEVANSACTEREQRESWGNKGWDERKINKKRNKCRDSERRRWRNTDDRQSFEKDYRAENKKKLQGLEQGNQESTETIETAKIWNLIDGEAATASSGKKLKDNVFLDAWSVYGGAELKTGAGTLFSPILKHLAQGNGSAAALESFQLDWASARGRIFFDCSAEDAAGRSNAEGGIHSCADNSMWRPGGWKWLLARDIDAKTALLESGKQALAGHVGHLTGKGAEFILGWILWPLAGHTATNHAGPALGHMPLWQQRINGTLFADGARGRTGGGHISSWWFDNMAGGAVGDALDGEDWREAFKEPYLR